MELEFVHGQMKLAAYVADPPVAEPKPPTVVICHGYPSGALPAAAAGRSFPQLADRLANEGWRSITFTFRGCGTSNGDFSLGGWLEDVLSVSDQARSLGETRGVWLVGFGTGGALCLGAAARRPEIMGVAVLGAPADFTDWANHPRRLLRHAREVGVITRPDYPPSIDRWTRHLRDIRPVDDAAEVAPRPLLILHGSEDESVPTFDARVLADSHGSAELRIVAGGAHDLLHDPRAVAILAGWLDRQRHSR